MTGHCQREWIRGAGLCHRACPTRHADAARKIGNLPITAEFGVHAADDVVLTATGPGADIFRGRIDNTRVFAAMARALGLGAETVHSGANAANGQSTSAR